MEVDYIIVGQGLAGSALAMQFIRRGKKILVIDEFSKNNSSRVAAGLFNPVTGKNAVKTWMAEQLFPYLHHYYVEIEQITGKKFFFSMPLYRPFSSIQEQNEWMARSADTAYKQYIDTIHTSTIDRDNLNDQLGGLVLKQSGYLNTTAYLDAVRTMIESAATIRQQFFDEDRLTIQTDFISYDEFRARKIIFCQGEKGIRNKWFKDLPIRPLKGETIQIQCEWKKNVILNRGVYMVPGGASGEYRVGSTYKFNDDSMQITVEGRQELEDKLRALIKFPYTVMDQKFGIRPTTNDRRPVLGRHPESEKIVIFNGLGAKGVSLAPYFSEVLFHWVENSADLNKEVDVARYY